MAWRLAGSPTRRSPDFANATTDGVVRFPSEFSNTSGSPPSMVDMQELVVPRSIPITFAIRIYLLIVYYVCASRHEGFPSLGWSDLIIIISPTFSAVISPTNLPHASTTGTAG